MTSIGTEFFPPSGLLGRHAALGRRALFGAAAAGAAVLPVAAQQGPAPAAPGKPGAPSAVIDVNRARAAPIPIAIPEFTSGSAANPTLGRDMVQVVTADLANCGLFKPLDPASFIQAAENLGEVPKWNDWKAIGAQALVTGRVQNTDGQVRVEFRLWDVLPEQQIQGTAYTTNAANWRRISHIIADVIYQRLLGEKGYFDTRIIYISATGPRNRRVKRLAIMDQDSANNRFLSDGSWLVLTPRFHPTRDEIAFMSYANNRPRVYIFDLGSGRQRMLGEWRGMTFAPRFSPDGGKVILAETRGGGSNIYVIDLASGRETQLTDSGAIDVSPCYSPDGSQIVFNSDRGGDQQLYVMNPDGSNVRRISFGSGRYATPVWSPRGDLIAYTHLGGDAWGIGVMHPDGSGERILSQGFAVEGPTFCPNGRVIMFWRETPARDSRGDGYSSRLVSVDITGFHERVAPTPTDATDPAWSPLGA
uniref:Tol-Pal system protein TolB n=1 Tax=Acidicaldus sp. TaxID=1872105 RepID=A0A8J4M6E3_9PROT